MWGPITFAIAAAWSAFVLTYDASWPGLLTVLATVGFSFFMLRRERRAGVVVALALLGNWALGQLTYLDHPLQITLAEWGFKFKTVQLWAFFDALVGLAIVVSARRYAFGLLMFGLFAAQEGLHELRLRGWDYHTYRLWLDVTWLTMLAIIVIRGFPGARDAIISAMVRDGSGGGMGLRGRVGLAKKVKP